MQQGAAAGGGAASSGSQQMEIVDTYITFFTLDNIQSFIRTWQKYEAQGWSFLQVFASFIGLSIKKDEIECVYRKMVSEHITPKDLFRTGLQIGREKTFWPIFIEFYRKKNQ